MTEKELARVAFVTRHFSALQGLKLVALGGGLIVGAVSWHLMLPEYRNLGQQVILPAMMLQGFVATASQAHYAGAFGRVPRRRNTLAVTADEAAVILIGVGLLIDMIRSLARPGGASLACAAMAGYSLLVLVRDRGMRRHYLLGLLAGGLGVALTWSAPALSRAAFEADPLGAGSFVVAYAVLGLSLLAVGLLDHRLLAITMSRGTHGQSNVVPDASVSWTRAWAGGGCLVVLVPFLVFLRNSEYLGLVHIALFNVLVWGNFLLARRFSGRQFDVLAAARSSVSEASAEPVPLPRRMPPRFEPLGHFALPMAMGAGAVADLALAGSGMPSLLALAFCASHLWIALRDRPGRVHYVLGALAGGVSALHFSVTGPDGLLLWGVSFAFLVSAAAVVEGIGDLRLSRQVTPQILE